MGRCGCGLCCANHLCKFEPISMRMAREQDLPLNPANISGVCGRLLCCLAYESEQYRAMKKQMPTPGKNVKKCSDAIHSRGPLRFGLRAMPLWSSPSRRSSGPATSGRIRPHLHPADHRTVRLPARQDHRCVDRVAPPQRQCTPARNRNHDTPGVALVSEQRVMCLRISCVSWKDRSSQAVAQASWLWYALLADLFRSVEGVMWIPHYGK